VVGFHSQGPQYQLRPKDFSPVSSEGNTYIDPVTELTIRGQETRNAILLSARQELARSGILGLRVAEVAEGADTSVTSIYRLFGDRDGLLAQVLGDIIEEIIEGVVEQFRLNIRDRRNMTVRDLADSVPLEYSFRDVTHKFRLQVLAAATENPALAARLREVFVHKHVLWKEALSEVRRVMAPGEDFDDRIFFGFLFDYTPYSSSYLGSRRLSVEEFRELLADKLRVSRPR
jgi:AcrR family transcriptional regulator